MNADLLVVGAGVCGLWMARKAARAGLRTVLVERRAAGSGASGGFLGALMPHMPDRWNEKKQFQLEALVSLEREVQSLEAATGMDCGYRRVGRLIPLPRDDLRALAERRAVAAALNWGGDRFDWSVVEEPPIDNWPVVSAAPHGLVYERLAARIDTRRLLAVLRQDLARREDCLLVEGEGVAAIDAVAGRVRLEGGRVLAYGHLVIAAGCESFPMIARLLGCDAGDVGGPVKGQAALVALEMPDDAPVVYSDGVYVVPHEDGTVAVGSTSEAAFADPFAADGRLDELLRRAMALCPVLAGAPILERWAGLRPRAIGREPLIGPLPGAPRTIALTGGYKTTFGMAHRLADAALSMIEGRSVADVPAGFLAETRLRHLYRPDRKS